MKFFSESLSGPLFIPTAKRQLIILVTLALTLIIAYFGLIQLTITVDAKSFFADDTQGFPDLKRINHKYGEVNNIGISVMPSEGDVFDKNVLAVVDQFTEASRQVAYSTGVDSLISYSHAYDQDGELTISPLLENYATKPPEKLAAIKQLYLSDQAVKSRLVSNNGHLTIALLSLNIPEKDSAAVQDVYHQVKKIVSELQTQHPAMDIRLIGTMMSEYSFATATQEELSKRMPYSIAIVILLLTILLRSFSGVFITLLITLLSALIAFGLKGHFNDLLTPVTGMAPTTIFTLAIADCVHLLSGFLLFYSTGFEKREALLKTLKLNVKAITLTSLTTVIGFLCFNFSSSPAIRDMGNVVATGVLIAWLLTLFLAPILILVMPFSLHKAQKKREDRFYRLANSVNRHAKLIAITFVIIVAGCLMGLPRNNINEVMIEMFDYSYEIRANAELINTELTGVSRLYFDLPAREDKNVSDLEYLTVLNAFTQWLKQQPDVRDVDTYSDFLKHLNQILNGNNQSYNRLPESTELAAQYLLLYEASMPSSGGLENLLAIDRRSSRVEVRVNLGDSQSILALKRAAEMWLNQNAPAYMFSPATSIDVLFAETSIKNAEAMYFGTLISLILISILITLAVRNNCLGLISFVANLLPILVAYGIWGYFKGRIGISEAMVATLTMGLVVDDSIHFITKFQDQVKRQPNEIFKAILYAYQHAGHAIFITTLVFVASFSVFLGSSYMPNVHLSMLTMLTLSLALLFDILLLPALILIFYTVKKPITESERALDAQSATEIMPIH